MSSKRSWNHWDILRRSWCCIVLSTHRNTTNFRSCLVPVVGLPFSLSPSCPGAQCHVHGDGVPGLLVAFVMEFSDLMHRMTAVLTLLSLCQCQELMEAVVSHSPKALCAAWVHFICCQTSALFVIIQYTVLMWLLFFCCATPICSST